ncbi:MAG TPA: ABC transporter ATP-binding protein [Opitutaceae bacterium]|nr:ABC transporter ATP-binding protein [Opitutaceae bacterium]
MREIELLKQVYRAYVGLGLKRRRLALVILMMGVTAVLEMVGLSILYPLVLALGSHGAGLSKVMAYVPFSGHFPADQRSQLALVFSLVALINIAKNVALYFTYQDNIFFATYFHRRIIAGLYGAYVLQPLADCRRQSGGELTNIVCTQSVRLIDGVVRPLLVVVTETALLVAICAVVLVVSPAFAAVTVIACGTAVVTYYILLRDKALAWGRERMDAASALHELVGNTALGISEIKAFGKEDYMTAKVAQVARLETRLFEKGEMHQQGPRFILESVFVLSFIGLFVVQVLAGTDLTVLLAKFSVIAASSFRILPSMSRLVNSYSNFSVNIGPAQTLLAQCARVIATTQSRRAAPDGPTFAGKSITLDRICFSYGTPNGKSVLKDLNLTINQGERVGILGPSGSGKSTLIELLAGLQVPTGGSIVVDGRPIDREIVSWQARVGYVPQLPFILPGTIRENVSFQPDDDSLDAEVWAALETAGIASFIRNFRSGLDTRIGEKGVGLSGGQRQMICLARALYRGPRVLLLDEPTAALDPESERTVLRAIDRLGGSVTIVMVSHKHQNFHGFDRIYRCENSTLSKLSAAAVLPIDEK